MSLPNKTSGILKYLGHDVDKIDVMDEYGVITITRWDAPTLQPTDQEIIDAVLPYTKHVKLTQIRAEANKIIETKWPAWRQNNCALGVYPEAVAAECADDIAAVIAASNSAEDAVDAATTVQDVEAVTPTWPVI